tara:strand:+ start:383 stop:1018 length:636 start_codon:yes stop_codon:yes gene_type:complete
MTERLIPCMPPLLEEETKPLSREDSSTKYGGTACENIVRAYFLAQNINVAEPDVDDGVDFLIEREPYIWKRAQVKKVVFQKKIDYGMQQRGKVVYRNRYNFNFQGGGSAPHLKNGRRQRRPEEVDYFYHVLLTPYRQLIWETPVELIPLRKDGSFIHGKNPSLDTNATKRRPADFSFNELLVQQHYHPIIFESFSDFFLEKPGTLEGFLGD